MEIKHCRFCGGEAEVKKYFDRVGTDVVPFRWAVTCLKCGHVTAARGTKKAAVKEWNRTED